MEDIKALSPEIIGLFTKIQNQAVEYGKAFDMLEQNRKEFVVAVDKINELEDNIRKESEIAISRINTNVLESIILLKNRTEETIKLSAELGDIKEFKSSLVALKNDLSQLHTQMQKQSEEIESALKFFRKKSEMELESTLLGLKTKVDKEINSEGQKIELRINLRLKQLESIFLSFDERIKLLEGSATSAFKKLSLEIDLIKHGYNFDSPDDSFIIDKHSDTSISNRLTAMEIMLNTVNEKIIEISDVPNSEPPTNISDKRIEDIDSKVGQINNKINEHTNLINQMPKSNSSATVSVIAIILALIAIVLSVI